MTPSRRIRARRTIQWPVVLALIALWCALHGSLKPQTVLTGLLLALLVLWLFPLPPLVFRGRVRPIGLAILVARFVYDVAVASLQLAWWVLRPPPPPRSSIIKVPMRTDSDGVMTLTALMISLVPGSLPVETSRSDRILYVHFIGAHDAETLEASRRSVRTQEERILRALSTDEQLAEAGLPVRGLQS